MEHFSVLFNESLQALNIKADGFYIDGTFGRGGHSQGILKQLGERGRLLAFDRDPDAIHSPIAQALLKDDRFELHYGCFSELADVVSNRGLFQQVDGVLMDLGVSSPQLDNPDRGFSFMQDGPLDMRMDVNAPLTAEKWLREVEEQELIKVLFEYGEERFAKRIARAVMTTREKQAIARTADLVKLVEQAIPYREKHKHPATRTFQAIRIRINSELQEVEAGLRQAVEVLSIGGRLVVISFHSLEDRIVKRFIRQESGLKHNPGRLPVKEEDIARGCLKKIGKAIKAGPEELKQNPRSRSAVMRIAEKVDA